jgi:lipoate-protein ligase A
MKARLILDPPRPALVNMALDSALFQYVQSAPFPATLRLYGWAPRAVSIGRRQKPDELDLALCEKMGIEVVKRPGGGAAVYHDEELTYAFACGTGWERPTPDLWRRVFVLLLENIGLAADSPVVCGDRHGSVRGACFSGTGEDEPTINGKKFVGGARRKSRTAFLQHGSILLESQPEFLSRIVKNSGTDRSAGLRSFLPGLGLKKLSSEFVGAVAETLQIEFVEGGYTALETEAAQKIATPSGLPLYSEMKAG